MANVNDITNLITAELFRNEVACGPNLVDKEYFPIKNSAVSDVVGKQGTPLVYVVPSETFHPEIFVSFDFTHSFVEVIQDQKASPEQCRLIPEENLRNIASKVYKFINYYLDTAGSYDAIKSAGDFQENINIENKSEDEINVFLNEAVNYFLTSINTQTSRRDIGSATVILKDTKNLIGRTGNRSYRLLADMNLSVMYQLFVPMIPITIWAKGRLYRNYYFPIFDGYISSVATPDNQGFAEVQLTCKDVLELARISNEMVRPSIIKQAEVKNIDTLNFQAMPFFNHDHIEIVKRLFLGGKLSFVQGDTNAQAQLKLVEQAQSTQTEQAAQQVGSNGLDFMKLEEFNYIGSDEDGFPEKLGSYYDSLAIRNSNMSVQELVRRTSHKQNPRNLILWGSEITPYRIFNISDNVDMFKSDFSSRLDVLNEVAELIYHDFYVDGAGNVNFHPQRLSNDFLINDIISYVGSQSKMLINEDIIWPGANVFGPEEVISCNTMLNIDELITHLKVVGQNDSVADIDELGYLVGRAVHRKYLNRFGYRRELVNSQLFNTNYNIDGSLNKTNSKTAGLTFGNLFAGCLLVYKNAELYTKEVSLVFRPELTLCRPVFFTEDKTVFYINSISHSINIGGDATTTVNCSFGRKDYETPADLFNFMIATQKLYVFRDISNIDQKDLLRKLPIQNWEEFLDNEDLEAIRESKIASDAAKQQQELNEKFYGEQEERSTGVVAGLLPEA